MQQFKIKIEQKHIAKGKPKSEEYCPIACAIKEQTNFQEVRVYRSYAVFGHTSWCNHSMIFCDRIKKFIDEFDRKLPVKPFSFILRSVG